MSEIAKCDKCGMEYVDYQAACGKCNGTVFWL